MTTKLEPNPLARFLAPSELSVRDRVLRRALKLAVLPYRRGLLPEPPPQFIQRISTRLVARHFGLTFEQAARVLELESLYLQESAH